MTPRVLVAGVGNVFFGDDGFGPELARRLAARPLPPGVRAADFGIRGLHLAYELLEPLDLLVVADAVRRGGPPGELYLLAPELEELPGAADGHAMALPAVFAALRAMGGTPPRLLLVGCEPSACEGLGLSEPVAGALDAAAELVLELAARAGEPAPEPVREAGP
ncbi:hydrogenase maturation protease [Anaeromyxobacter paludicola]|uniref:Peptidase M52 n=1 Tax=Anaeromyxobacter paludicola TaxID=2918171 RepID=A0ABN6N7I7_9BACT|nr:hydrogenase maturation protease [Anaeromyxobacter paludicola]BDG07950.1 peptidase M52 [Anaeromyxobacter paludicola]